MAGAAVKILAGLGDKSLNDDQAEDFLKWMGDLAGDSFEDDDDSFLEARIHFIYFKTKFILRMVYFSVMTQANSEKRSSECSYQESNLRPFDY